MDRAVVAQMVHRYLVEEGHKFAAMAFLDSAPKADQGEHAHGALLELLDRAEEMQRVAEASCTTAETAKADEEARILERPGDGVYCDAQVAKLEGTHNLSIVATTLVSMPPSLSAAAAKDDNKTKQLELLTASADRTLRLTPLSGLPLFAIPDEGRVVAHAAAPVLCFDMRPTGVDSKEGGPLVVAYGDMGGHVALVDLISGTTLSTRRDHRKYCVRMAWSDDGTLLATAGYDSTVCLYAVRDKGTSKETEEATAAAVTADGKGGEGEGGGGARAADVAAAVVTGAAAAAAAAGVSTTNFDWTEIFSVLSATNGGALGSLRLRFCRKCAPFDFGMVLVLVPRLGPRTIMRGGLASKAICRACSLA